jgi:hypothetical protein
MDSIKVNRINLLNTLKTNRTAHAEEYALAEKGYWLEFETRLAKALKQIRKHGRVERGTFGGFGLEPSMPQNHTSDYDTVIKMLEFSVDDIIELDSARFQQYVMDNWQWTSNVKAINTYFAGVAGASK